MMKTETTPFDPADWLGDDDDQIELMRDAFASGDALYIANAIGTVARARNVSQLARDVGMTRAGLYKAFSAEGDPKLSTLLGVIDALGFRLSVESNKRPVSREEPRLRPRDPLPKPVRSSYSFRMIWIVFALLTGAAVFSVLWPLAHVPAGSSRRDADLAFYRSEVEGIGRDVASGLMSPEDAEVAKAEAARRLLAGAGADAGMKAASTRSRRIAAIAAIVLVPAVTIGLYVFIGSPDIADQPLAARLAAPAERMDIAAAVARIEQHLAAEPNDGRGWELIAPVYLRMGRAADAANAYAKAITVLGDSADRETARGEALMAAAGGQVSPEATAAFDAALRLDKDAPGPRFYQGLAAQQAGDTEKATKIWTDLVAAAPPGAPWVEVVKQQLAALGAPIPRGPQAEAIAGMAPEARNEAIRGMVAALGERLAAKGGSVEEWTRLVRAYGVRGEKDKARAALADARKALNADETARPRLDAIAREFGLEG